VGNNRSRNGGLQFANSPALGTRSACRILIRLGGIRPRAARAEKRPCNRRAEFQGYRAQTLGLSLVSVFRHPGHFGWKSRLPSPPLARFGGDWIPASDLRVRFGACWAGRSNECLGVGNAQEPVPQKERATSTGRLCARIREFVTVFLTWRNRRKGLAPRSKSLLHSGKLKPFPGTPKIDR
jgi:hypothetical protein